MARTKKDDKITKALLGLTAIGTLALAFYPIFSKGSLTSFDYFFINLVFSTSILLYMVIFR